MPPIAQVVSEVEDKNDIEVDLNGVPNNDDVEATTSVADPDSPREGEEDESEPVSASLKIRSALC